MERKVEEAVIKIPEVALMFSKTGTAEVASDPMPPNVSDGFVILKEKDQWAEGTTKADVVAKIEKATGGLLGNLYEVSQPIQLRFHEMIAGVRGDVAMKLCGDELTKLALTGNAMATRKSGVEGMSEKGR